MPSVKNVPTMEIYEKAVEIHYNLVSKVAMVLPEDTRNFARMRLASSLAPAEAG
jgi:hypothetical protein